MGRTPDQTRRFGAKGGSAREDRRALNSVDFKATILFSSEVPEERSYCEMDDVQNCFDVYGFRMVRLSSAERTQTRTLQIGDVGRLTCTLQFVDDVLSLLTIEI